MLTVVGAGRRIARPVAASGIRPLGIRLWFYRITNNGFPVGLFANRNHAAVFLAALLPLATAWALGQKMRGAPRRGAPRSS